MSTFISPVLDHQEQLCYVHCSQCTTILLVSVPCTSLSMVATVKCGHCTTLLSVNMTNANFLPPHLHSSPVLNLHGHDQVVENVEIPMVNTIPPRFIMSSDDEDVYDSIHVVNKPPEKRQRVPSAYNNFIREEIKRLKAKHPKMLHKEAFSAAAKNWADQRKKTDQMLIRPC